jgi:hypothetical protein
MVTKENQRFLLVYKVMNDIVAINQFRGEFFGNFISPNKKLFDERQSVVISRRLQIRRHRLSFPAIY